MAPQLLHVVSYQSRLSSNLIKTDGDARTETELITILKMLRLSYSLMH